MQINIEPVATVSNTRLNPTDDFWGNVISEIALLPHIPENAFKGIEQFSHLEILYYFDKVDDSRIVFSGRPRGNPEWPEMGIFCQRKKDRPNRLGLCTVELVEHTGRTIKVKYLDAIEGTPVLDVKPVFKEFEPKGAIRQPQWTIELMADYWK
jgi:tRNA-Thr(GGU) m(6)t(6)A37 methyltransferase TsaA